MSYMRATKSYGHNAICDVCGFKFKNFELKKRWDGYMVCKNDYEMRHPIDFYTTRNDTHLLPWTRSDSNGIDVSPIYFTNDLRVTANGDDRITSTGDYREVETVNSTHSLNSAIAGYAIAGQAIASYK